MNILLLEDDKNLGLLVKEHLEMNHYEVELRTNGEAGLQAYKEHDFNLCLVDIMMPKKDGFTFAREIRNIDSDLPLIFLTAKSLKEDKIEGFKIGCDDYLTKPFSLEELLMRISAVMKRYNRTEKLHDNNKEYSIGSFKFSYKEQKLYRESDTFKLTTREAELLKLLCQHKNQTLERKKALREIWGNTSYFSGRSMDVYISKLRKYLKPDENIEIIGIHGKGFRLIER